jgi:hypothetical protein
VWGGKRGEGGWEGECWWFAFAAVVDVAVAAVDICIAVAAVAAAVARVVVAVVHIVVVAAVALVHIVPVLVVVVHIVLAPAAPVGVAVWPMAQGSHTQVLVRGIGGTKR